MTRSSTVLDLPRRAAGDDPHFPGVVPVRVSHADIGIIARQEENDQPFSNNTYKRYV